jgi:hypothetical protein
MIIETEIIIPFDRRRTYVAEPVCPSQAPSDEERLR